MQSGHSGSSPSVAIVGAGPGGLSTAMILAASGARVTVFETMDRVGGRTSRVTATAEGGDQYHFDRGPTFFLMPYVLDEVFAAAGEKLTDHVELHRLDPMYRLLIGQPGQRPAQIDTTQDIAEMARRIGKLSQKDAETFPRFIAENRKKLQLSEPILRKAMRSPLDLVDVKNLPLLPLLKPHKSVHDLLGEYFTDERVKLAVSFQSKYLGMSPFECPSLFTILPLIEYEYGVWHPMGGCHAICHAMARVAEKHGAEIRLSTPVERVTFMGNQATGVLANGQSEQFDAVVMNADASWAIKNLIPASVRTGKNAGYTDESMDKKKYSCSTAMLYLGVEGEIDLPHHTIYTSGAYRQNLDDIAVNRKLSEDPSVYLCNASGIDKSLAPAGNSSLYVLAPTPNLERGPDGSVVDWESQWPAYRESILDQIEDKFGIGDIRGRVRAETVIRPPEWEGMNINHGATFNLAHNLGQMLHWRPQNKLKGFERLYMVGGGTHPGSGLPTIFLSSQISSGLLCKDLGMGCTLDDVPVTPVSEREPEAVEV
ncbi:MAG: phytoene desaturase family protein [Planctomycetota bacterium]